MEKYLDEYDNLDRKIVYNFTLGNGGIGDCIKFFMYLLNYCIKYNIQIRYLQHNIELEKYLRLNYKKFYITCDEISDNKIDIQNENEIQHIKSNIYYIIHPGIFYNTFPYDVQNICKAYDTLLPAKNIFHFSDEVILNSKKLITIDHYISIHLRLGDIFLETDLCFIACQHDIRPYNEDKLFQLIEKNITNKKILFFCDNRNYKLKIKEKYNNIITTDANVGHTSLSNTTSEQILDAVTEFFIMSKSEKIYAVTISGFSIMSSKYHNIDFEYI
jgi:hypothetical protein